MKNTLLLCVLFCTLFAAKSKSQEMVWSPDNRNGTFTNPIMWGDWPDPDIIRVGSK